MLCRNIYYVILYWSCHEILNFLALLSTGRPRQQPCRGPASNDLLRNTLAEQIISSGGCCTHRQKGGLFLTKRSTWPSGQGGHLLTPAAEAKQNICSLYQVTEPDTTSLCVSVHVYVYTVIFYLQLSHRGFILGICLCVYICQQNRCPTTYARYVSFSVITNSKVEYCFNC